MSTAYRAEFLASRPGAALVHDAELAMITSAVAGAIDAHCIVDTDHLRASLVNDSIVSVVVPFHAASDVEASAIAEAAARSVWDWSVEHRVRPAARR